ncbi:hypothetical protein GALL_438730 [mine drainage metagenome]|uniref:Uncharacterized protein n=1 Tax=mine drainage metagenome TaxID=410659 RepID=A0A1J5Q3K1_9ZZZZ
MDHIWRGEGANGLPHLLLERADQLFLPAAARVIGIEDDIAVDALALDGMGVAHHGGLGHGLMRHQRALDLGNGHALQLVGGITQRHGGRGIDQLDLQGDRIDQQQQFRAMVEHQLRQIVHGLLAG